MGRSTGDWLQYWEDGGGLNHDRNPESVCVKGETVRFETQWIGDFCLLTGLGEAKEIGSVRDGDANGNGKS